MSDREVDRPFFQTSLGPERQIVSQLLQIVLFSWIQIFREPHFESELYLKTF